MLKPYLDEPNPPEKPPKLSPTEPKPPKLSLAFVAGALKKFELSPPPVANKEAVVSISSSGAFGVLAKGAIPAVG